MKKKMLALATSMALIGGLYFASPIALSAESNTSSGGYYFKVKCLFGPGYWCGMSGNGCGLKDKCGGGPVLE